MGVGGAGITATYQESAVFTQDGGAFVLDVLSSNALGNRLRQCAIYNLFE